MSKVLAGGAGPGRAESGSGRLGEAGGVGERLREEAGGERRSGLREEAERNEVGRRKEVETEGRGSRGKETEAEGGS